MVITMDSVYIPSMQVSCVSSTDELQYIDAMVMGHGYYHEI